MKYTVKLLPTKDCTNLYRRTDDTELHIGDYATFSDTATRTNQHVYVLANETIENFDYFWFHGEVRQALNIIAEPVNQGKVIATTNFDLDLPKLDKEQVEEMIEHGLNTKMDDFKAVIFGNTVDIDYSQLTFTLDEVKLHLNYCTALVCAHSKMTSEEMKINQNKIDAYVKDNL